MCPTVTRAVKGRLAPWMSDEIREAMGVRNELQKELKLDHNNPLLRQRYKGAKYHVKSLIKITTAEYYHDRLKQCKGNSSVTWKIINEIIPNSKNTHNAQNFSNPYSKAQDFNKLFFSVGESTYKRSQEELKLDGISVTGCPHPDIDVKAGSGLTP